jgi:hypothetical protein
MWNNAWDQRNTPLTRIALLGYANDHALILLSSGGEDAAKLEPDSRSVQKLECQFAVASCEMDQADQ